MKLTDSYAMINLFLVVMWIAHFAGLEQLQPVLVPISFSVSYYLLVLLNVIKKPYKKKGISAVMHTVDKDGKEASITISENGDIKTTGHPDPDIVEALTNLRESIIAVGPEYVVKEFKKQLDESQKK